MSDWEIRKELVLEATDLGELMAEFSGPGRGRSFRCPLHEDKRPSLQVKGRKWTCYSCSEHGDAIDLVRLLQRRSFFEAVEYLEQRLGIPGPVIGGNTRRALAVKKSASQQAREDQTIRRREYHRKADQLAALKKEMKRYTPMLMNGSPVAARFMARAVDAKQRLEVEMDRMLESREV